MRVFRRIPRTFRPSAPTPRPGILGRWWLYHLADSLTGQYVVAKLTESAGGADRVLLRWGSDASWLRDLPTPGRRSSAHCQDIASMCVRELSAALDEGRISAGECVDALSEASTSYAFGVARESAVVDEEIGDEIRGQLDALFARIMALPELAWMSEAYSASAYPWFLRAPGGRARRGEHVDKLARGRMMILGTRRPTPRVPGVGKAILGASWWPGDQLTRPHVESFREIPAGIADTTCSRLLFGDDADAVDPASIERGALAWNQPRVFEVREPADWAALVERFPAHLDDSDARRYGWQGRASGLPLTVDWAAAAAEYDGVHVSVAGAMRCLYVPVPLDPQRIGDAAWTMMTGWVPGHVLWIDDEASA